MNCGVSMLKSKLDELGISRIGNNTKSSLVQLLVDNGYVEYAYCENTIAELKTILRSKGLSTNGRKNKLITRIIESSEDKQTIPQSKTKSKALRIPEYKTSLYDIPTDISSTLLSSYMSPKELVSLGLTSKQFKVDQKEIDRHMYNIINQRYPGSIEDNEINITEAFYSCAGSGDIDTAKWLYYSNKKLQKELIIQIAIGESINYGQLDILKWLFSLHKTIKVTFNLFLEAAGQGHLDIMKWMNNSLHIERHPELLVKTIQIVNINYPDNSEEILDWLNSFK